MSPPQLGERAPNPSLIGLNGRPFSLADVWTVQPMGFTGPRRISFTMGIDRDRSAYRAFGLAEGEATELLRPRVAAAWVGVHLRGEGRQGGSHGGSLVQLPGTFLVDAGGMLRFVHRNRHQADDPDVQHLLDACRAIAA